MDHIKWCQLWRLIVLHYVTVVPDDAVLVERSCRVKPEMEPLLPPCAHIAVAVQVGLQNPLVPLYMSKKLEVYFVVVSGEDLGIRQLCNSKNKHKVKFIKNMRR